MTNKDRAQLSLNIKHILSSGANEIRFMEMIESFISKRYTSRNPTEIEEEKARWEEKANRLINAITVIVPEVNTGDDEQMELYHSIHELKHFLK